MSWRYWDDAHLVNGAKAANSNVPALGYRQVRNGLSVTRQAQMSPNYALVLRR